MNKIYLLLVVILAGLSSCKDTQSYADLVDAEKSSISKWIDGNPYGIDFGNVISHDESWLNDVTKKVLRDSVAPSEFIQLGQWYTFSNGDFKRYYFRINDWGNSPKMQGKGGSFYENKITSDEFQKPDGKKYGSSNIMVRYDSLFCISQFDYKNVSKNVSGNNLDPNSYLLIYSWRSNYYSTNYYSMYYSTTSSYECTSGGLAFPCRFLWYGGSATMIVPFSLVPKEFSSYYYTLYYGDVTYTRPNYMPQ